MHSHLMTQTHLEDDAALKQHTHTHQCDTQCDTDLCDRVFVFLAGRERHTMFPARVENTGSCTW